MGQGTVGGAPPPHGIAPVSRPVVSTSTPARGGPRGRSRGLSDSSVRVGRTTARPQRITRGGTATKGTAPSRVTMPMARVSLSSYITGGLRPTPSIPRDDGPARVSRTSGLAATASRTTGARPSRNHTAPSRRISVTRGGTARGAAATASGTHPAPIPSPSDAPARSPV